MVNIVGAGLAGSILKRYLDFNGIESRIFDCEKDWRASIISENLFSLTWRSTLGDKVVDNGIMTLNKICDIKSISFDTGKTTNNTLHVHPNDILIKDYINEEIISVDQDGCRSSSNYYSGTTILCTGYWASKFINEKTVGLTGQGLFFEGKLEGKPMMNFVAPYVHQKKFQWDDQYIWYGDSTCIDYNKYINNKESYTGRCIKRAIEFGLNNPAKVVYGIRPFINKEKGFLRFNKNTVINSGGWKCGMIIYADHAQKIVTWLKSI